MIWHCYSRTLPCVIRLVPHTVGLMVTHVYISQYMERSKMGLSKRHSIERLGTAILKQIINVSNQVFISSIIRLWMDFSLPPRCPRPCGANEGRLSHFLWLRPKTGWQSMISQEKIPRNTPPRPEIELGPRWGQAVSYIHSPTKLSWLINSLVVSHIWDVIPTVHSWWLRLFQNFSQTRNYLLILLLQFFQSTR